MFSLPCFVSGLERKGGMKRSADLGYIVPHTVFVGEDEEEEGLLYLFLFSLSLCANTH